MYKEEEKGQAALNRALDLGINYVDTAYSYGDGVSETWVGGVMKQRRKGVFLVTKVEAATVKKRCGSSKEASNGCRPIIWI